MQVIVDFMERTFQFRRCDVLQRKFSLNDLLLSYPPLRDPDEVNILFLGSRSHNSPYSLVVSLTE